MPLTYPATLTAHTTAAAADVQGNFDAISTLLNTTGLDASYLQSGIVTNSVVAAGADIAVSKLAEGTSAQVLLTNGSSTPTWTSLSGDVTVGATGTTAIGTGVIVNADVSASADIAHSKLVATTAGYILMGTTSTGVITATALSGDATITGGGVMTIANNAVTNAKMADNAVNTAEIVDDAVTPDKIATTSTFRVSKSNTQSISATTNTTVEFNSTDFDPATGWSGVNYDWTVPSTGKYLVGASVNFSSGTTRHIIDVYKDGSFWRRLSDQTGSSFVSQANVTYGTLTSGEKIRVNVFTTTGGTTVSGSGVTTEFWARRVE